MYRKKNKLDDHYINNYIDQYKNDGSTENSP
jgi:hypothetical protein